MRRKLLVIDDQAGIGRIVSLVAEANGFEVRAITDPRQAVAAFMAFNPDMVMLHLVMPELDGIHVLNALLASGIPAQIVLTASAGIGDAYRRIANGVARFHGLGPMPFLRKPFNQAELLAMLNDGPQPGDDQPA